MIEPGVDGVVVPPDDPDALGEALENLVTQPERAFQMGRAAREKAEGSFGIERHLEALDTVYEEARHEVGRWALL